MKKIIIAFLMLVISVCVCCAFVGCASDNGSTNNGGKDHEGGDDQVIEEDGLDLTVGENYVIKFGDKFDGDIVAESDNGGVLLTVLGRDVQILAVKKGKSVVTLKHSGVSERYVFYVKDSEKSARKNGLYISCASSLKTIIGLTTPVLFGAEIRYDGEPVNGTLSFTMEDTSVATVSEAGVVAPVSEGNTRLIVRAEYNGVSAEKKVNIFVYPDADIITEKSHFELFLEGNATEEIKYDLYVGNDPATETEKSLVTFRSRNTDVCEVNEEGKITAKSFGKTSVVVDYGGVTAEIDVCVYNEEILVREISDLADIKEGTYYRFATDLEINFARKGDELKYEEECFIDTLETTIDGDSHSVTITGFCGDYTSEHNTHKHNLNFIKTIGKNGVVKNMTINYNLRPQSNVVGGTCMFAENNGLVENVVINLTYQGWYVIEGNHISYFGTGVGTYRNVIATITNTSWQNNQEIYRDLFWFSEGILKFENVLVVGKALMKMPKEGQNLVRVLNGIEYKDSEFSVLDFNAEYWTVEDGEIPKLGRIETVEVDNLSDLAAFAAEGNKNMRLTADLIIDLDETNGTTQFAIDSLSTTLDGCGHTVTINLKMGSSANNSVSLGLVHTITPTGKLKNLKVFVTHAQTGNNAFGTLFISKNQGIVENIEYNFVWISKYWFNNNCTIFGGGSGMFRNCVIYYEKSRNYYNLFSSGTFENILVVGSDYDSSAALYANKNNCVVTSADDYASSGYDARALDENYWNVGNGVVPTLKTAPRKVVDVNDLESLAIYAATGSVDMRLASDLTIDLDETNGTTQFAIDVLSTTLDGCGHTVTINLKMGSSANNSVSLGLVNTITATGKLKNMKVVVTHTQTGNNAFGTLFINKNQGVVENIEYDFVWISKYWFNNNCTIFGGGSGIFRNCVIYYEWSRRYYNMFSSGTFENILVVGADHDDSAALYAGKNNCVVTSADDYAASGYDATVLDEEYWNIAEGETPTLKTAA